MNITLMHYTGKGEGQWAAAELLILSKSTRLEMSPSVLDNIKNMSDEEKLAELEYMSNTIPSSWEFCDYTFLIQGVSRAFTHQLVRNRHGSYAQQTMRILDVSGFDYVVGPTIENNEELMEDYCDFMATCNAEYQQLIKKGAAIEDARGVLPTNIKTNILVKFNLRTLAETVSKRTSPRVQGEYRDFLEKLVLEVLEVHPWAKLFLRNNKIEAAQKLYEFIEFSGVSKKATTELYKLVDLLKGR